MSQELSEETEENKLLLPSFRALKERETSYEEKEEKEDIEEESVDERENSGRDFLKQELDQVLKGIRDMGNQGDGKKHHEESSEGAAVEGAAVVKRNNESIS